MACGVLFVALNAAPTVLATTGHMFGDYWRQFVLVGAALGSPWASPHMTPPTLTALVVLGLAAAPLHGRAGLLWLAAALIADPLYFPAYRGDAASLNYANARYHLPALYLACGLAGLGVAALVRILWPASRSRFRWRDALLRVRGCRDDGPRAPRGLGVPAMAAFAMVLLAAVPRFDLLRQTWTPQREYAFFRHAVATIDPACRIVTLEYTRDSGWAPFEYLVPAGLLDISEFLAGGHRGCAVYYRCGNCYTSDLADAESTGFEMHPACRAIEERFRLEPIVEQLVAAVPYRTEIYARDPLPLGFFRLHEK